MGLSITRDFSCFRLEKSAFLPIATQYEVHFLSEIHNCQWEYLRLFWDFEPSWQNSIDFIGAAKEEFAYSVIYRENEIAGYGVVDKNTGDVPQIAVHKKYRRRGIATNLVGALLKCTEAEGLQVINIDSSCEGTKLF